MTVLGLRVREIRSATRPHVRHVPDALRAGARHQALRLDQRSGLADSVEELAKANIEHVTITINCIDPEVGKSLPLGLLEEQAGPGSEAAKILIDRQQQGLEMLVERDILVKVNSVMIPGVNDEHLAEVSKVVKKKGAFLHNVMPLIAERSTGPSSA